MYLEKNHSLLHSPNTGESRGYLKLLGTQMEYPTKVLIWIIFKINDQINDEVKQTPANSINSKAFRNVWSH